MTVRYHTVQGRLAPDYVCQRAGIEQGLSICQRIVGAAAAGGRGWSGGRR